MGKSKRQKGRRFLRTVLIFLLMLGWNFSGWPSFGPKMNWPPSIPVAYAVPITQHPSAFTNTTGFNGNFTSPANAYSTNGIYASASPTKRNNEYATNWRGFNFSTIPAGSIINSVTVHIIEKMSVSNSLGELRSSVWEDVTSTAALTAGTVGALDGGAQFIRPATDTADYDWSYSLTTLPTLTQLQAANFGVRVQYAGGNTTGPIAYVDDIYVIIEYSALSLPTVTTQMASGVEETTATGNGNITDTGGENADIRGFVYDTASRSLPGNVAPASSGYASSAQDSGSFPSGPFTKSLTGLNSGTTYYIRAFAHNGAGYSYGNETSFLTKPAAPTGVQASDGTYGDKVAVTWTKSTGATGYRVYRDGSDVSGLLGDVATYDDTGAGAPFITAGSSVATDGTSSTQVDLSLSGTSVSNGTTHTYKVVASNATGASADSATDTGYRGAGSLTYQWQRSAGDSDASYSDITGATAATYADTDAPADGSARYYRCVLNATGASQQISAADRGFKGIISITIEPGSGAVSYGTVVASRDTTASGTDQTQTVRNSGNIATDFDIKGQHSADWTLGGAAGNATYVHQWCTQNCDTSPVWNSLSAAYAGSYLASNVPADGTVSFDLKIIVPTSNPGPNQQNVNVHIQATQH